MSEAISQAALPGRETLYDSQCPLLHALNIIGQKWKLPILWYLSKDSTLRYGELKRRVKGITNTMLTKCLQELETDGLVSRTQFETIPPKVEYALTANGQTLQPILSALYQWGSMQLAPAQAAMHEGGEPSAY